MIDFPVSGVKAKLQIWDTAGQEKYRSVTPIYYRDAAAAICVFDVTNKESLEDARKWLSDLRQYAPPHIVIGLAGNKCDLYQQEEVSLEMARHFQEENKIDVFQQTSAKENIGIEELFKGILEKLEVNKNMKKVK
jgi:Ras-related protein Rab-5C